MTRAHYYLTADSREYTAVLNARYCMVKCPACGAKAGMRCIGQYGRRTKSTHADRKNAAASKGYVLGRRGDINLVRAWGMTIRRRRVTAALPPREETPT